MKKNNKKSILLIVILTIVTLAISVGGTYAYFQAQVSQGINSRVSVTAISGLTISFDNGNGFNFDNVMPGNSWTKQISVKLTNKNKELDEIEYCIKIHINFNTFDDKTGYLQYKVDGENTDFVDITKDSGDITIIKNKKIKGVTTTYDVTQNYNLTIKYPNLDTPQEQGGTFDGYIYFIEGHEKELLNYYRNPNPTKNSDDNDDKTTWKATDYNNLQIGDMLEITNGEDVDEWFYYYKTGTDGKKYFLAEWNIDVGTLNGYTPCYYMNKTHECLYNGPATSGWQSSNVRGNHEDKRYYNGIIEYSYSGSDYTGSYLEMYINEYLSKLITLEVETIQTMEATAITDNELESLGCSSSSNSCSGAPDWVYQTSFWSGSEDDDGSVWVVGSGSGCDWMIFYSYGFGVRPVIIF